MRHQRNAEWHHLTSVINIKAVCAMGHSITLVKVWGCHGPISAARSNFWYLAKDSDPWTAGRPWREREREQREREATTTVHNIMYIHTIHTYTYLLTVYTVWHKSVEQEPWGSSLLRTCFQWLQLVVSVTILYCDSCLLLESSAHIRTALRRIHEEDLRQRSRCCHTMLHDCYMTVTCCHMLPAVPQDVRLWFFLCQTIEPEGAAHCSDAMRCNAMRHDWIVNVARVWCDAMWCAPVDQDLATQAERDAVPDSLFRRAPRNHGMA